MVGKAGIVYVMGLALIFGMISWNMNRYSVETTGNMETYTEGTIAHNLALAGANIGLMKLYQNHGWGGNFSQNFNLPGLKGSANISLSLSGAKGLLTSVSTYSTWWITGGSIHDTIRVFIDVTDTNNFAQYAWFSGFPGNDQFWYDGDSVWGITRSNGGLHMGAGTEVFDGRVFYAKNITGPGTPFYLQGPPVKTVGVALPANLSEISSAATYGGKLYTGNVNVTFDPGSNAGNDGSMIVSTPLTNARVDSFRLAASGFNGAVWVNGDVHVLGGKVDGKVSIGSSNDIYIQGGGIRYEQDPFLGPSNDVLGLLATNNVTIGSSPSASDSANWPNCRIDAGVFALNGSFSANAPGGTGLLILLGSIGEGSKGSIMGANGKDGYVKRYHWDARFADANSRPPYFPGYASKTFKITNWWESPRHRPLAL